jgi:hypothetical protein
LFKVFTLTNDTLVPIYWRLTPLSTRWKKFKWATKLCHFPENTHNSSDKWFSNKVSSFIHVVSESFVVKYHRSFCKSYSSKQNITCFAHKKTTKEVPDSKSSSTFTSGCIKCFFHSILRFNFVELMVFLITFLFTENTISPIRSCSNIIWTYKCTTWFTNILIRTVLSKKGNHFTWPVYFLILKCWIRMVC